MLQRNEDTGLGRSDVEQTVYVIADDKTYLVQDGRLDRRIVHILVGLDLHFCDLLLSCDCWRQKHTRSNLQ